MVLKDKRVIIALTEQEHEKIKDYATKERTSVSSLMAKSTLDIIEK